MLASKRTSDASRFLSWLTIGCATLALVCSAGMTYAYNSFHPSDTGGCFQCHGDFQHGLHVGSNDMTNNCFLCHNDIGDNPLTWSSLQGVGCSGCHVGPGLRQHHAGAGAPPDNLGLFCVDCHSDDPTPPAENTLPPYYSRDDVNISDPCLVDALAGGEDWNNDGQGLDNDGNQLYEADDPGCSVTPVNDGSGVTPLAWRLHPCNPNPFNPLTTIRFDLPVATEVQVSVYTLTGRRVAQLVNQQLPAGSHEVVWSGRDQRGRAMPSGTYLYRLEAGSFSDMHTMTLVK